MTTCERQHGFTLIELIVVLGVLSVLLATAVPLAGAVVEADRRQEARRELGDLAGGLESYYLEHAAFPTTLSDAAFVGVHLQPGVNGTTLVDPFAAGAQYHYATSGAANTATVWSVGENGRDDGVATEEHQVVVHGAVPGTTRTWQRFRLIVELLANHIESGGAVTGPWATLRAAIGLGADYDRDGFGTVLDWNATTHTLTSAGPDRALGTADDITL
jgi:prepilin-type N-terminal cleavage/methylation domain-containing protein